MGRESSTFREALLAGAVEAGLTPAVFRPVFDPEAADVVAEVESRFGDAVQFPWLRAGVPSDLPVAARHFDDDQGWRYVDRIAPDPNAPCWFIAENWHGGSPRCLVFETSPEAVRMLLGNMHAFEYLVAGKSLDWLIAENHHSVVIVVGRPIVDRLAGPGNHAGGGP